MAGESTEVNIETRKDKTKLVWLNDIPDNAKELVYSFLDLFDLLALRTTNCVDRTRIDYYLTAKHIYKLLNCLKATDDVNKFIDFCKSCGYANGQVNKDSIISQYLFSVAIPSDYISQLTLITDQDSPPESTQIQEIRHAEDLSYIGWTTTLVFELTAPDNITSVCGYLYGERDFIITNTHIGISKHSVVSLGILFSTRGPHTRSVEESTLTLVAVKHLKRFGADNADYDYSDEHEGELLGALQHEIDVLSGIRKKSACAELYVTKILSIGDYDVAFHYYEHGDLNQFLVRNHSNITQLQRLLLSRYLLQCMMYTTKLRLLHRDIKASNILVEKDGTLRLCDFALAKFQHDQKSCPPYGSVLYQSPKIISHLKQILRLEKQNEDNYNEYDERYSVSLVLFQIFTCSLPFEEFKLLISNNNLTEFDEHLTNGGRPIIPKTLSKSVKALIQRGWQIDETKRPTFQESQSEITTELWRSK